jgi:hypothetical protein
VDSRSEQSYRSNLVMKMNMMSYDLSVCSDAKSGEARRRCQCRIPLRISVVPLELLGRTFLRLIGPLPEYRPKRMPVQPASQVPGSSKRANIGTRDRQKASIIPVVDAGCHSKIEVVQSACTNIGQRCPSLQKGMVSGLSTALTSSGCSESF